MPFYLNDNTRIEEELYIKDRGKTCQVEVLQNQADEEFVFLGYHMYANLLDQVESEI